MLQVLESRADVATWHVLQISNVLDEELAMALSESVPVIGWRPITRVLGGIGDLVFRPSSERRSATLRYHSFSLMRGYARRPVSAIACTGASVSRRLRTQSRYPDRDVLVCTTPFLVPVAERWQGPVVYWLTDRIEAYESAKGIDVPALDRRMCARANLVCPNSDRLREYLVQEAGCEADRIELLPNATRASNLLARPLMAPVTLPESISHRKRPVAGVLGNMGSNLDWPMLLQVVRATPWLTWLFVGPVGSDVPDPVQRDARAEVQYCRNACFIGPRPYGELVQYARGLDVAILPYRRREPTYSGSSTRFYEHLAACRPMIATRGFAELLHREPLIRLVGDAQEMIAALGNLRSICFHDGHEELRWRESFSNTWQARAQTMQAALASRSAALAVC